jgi:hypothetical protein
MGESPSLEQNQRRLFRALAPGHAWEMKWEASLTLRSKLRSVLLSKLQKKLQNPAPDRLYAPIDRSGQTT